jgi:CHASE3 domain sensor protein
VKSLSLSTRIIAASAVLAVLVAGVFAVLIYAVVTLDNAREREAASKDVRTALVGLEKLVIDLESGLRGVVLTGNPRFLEPARAAGRQVDGRARELERLVAPTQRGRVRALRGAINDYVDVYLLPLANLAQENLAAVRQTLVGVEARRQTDEIRASFNQLQETEDRRAAASAASATTQSRRAIVLGVAGLVACALLIVLFGLYLARSTAHPVREAATAATQLAEGDLSVRLSERGPGEVGELTAAFNHMAEELESQRRELQTQNEKLRESERRSRASSASHPCSSTEMRNRRSSGATSRSSIARAAGSRISSTTSWTPSGSTRAT